jgi:hypothetical protein
VKRPEPPESLDEGSGGEPVMIDIPRSPPVYSGYSIPDDVAPVTVDKPGLKPTN